MINNAKISPKANNGNVKKTQKFNQSSTEKNSSSKTTVKVNAMWYFVAEYLEMLKYVGAKYDEVFCRRLKSLLDYVYGKNELPTEFGDIVGEYVVYEAEV